ncbi:putative xyloglucan:xyloglucosyl transferase [Helianthus annuus]|uniref:Xyloglucan endotransglucosylase/hydrolase n=1 Tax=Helianthus annuus TaxID=4232 RepID=A0A251T9C6_HELAN|nr:probable xyloglucan endotransglucosylase/hydrolase protein 33 [Helianthus annuus]KAF5754731.1 putative xyloglucan:xyloglucosyl transferase [Helianthus annuus]
MAFLQEMFLLSCLVIFNSLLSPVLSRGPVYRPPPVEQLTDRFPLVPFTQGMSILFGASNVHLKNNGSYADIILDKTSGSGLVSKNRYYHGFFSAAIKLPAGFTSGVVLAFYMSNADVFPHNHDEIDFELLGYAKRRQWVLQTNMYGNGSVHTGREEKVYLWFDPTQEFHQYTILWNNHHIVFLVDNIPVREVIHNQAISSVYPSKPMSLYATIWDASEWATNGGKYPVDYKHAPFVGSLGELEIVGCSMQKTNSTKAPAGCLKNTTVSSLDPVDGEEYARLSKQQMAGLNWVRSKHMYYSYCKDTTRYKVMPAECNAH